MTDKRLIQVIEQDPSEPVRCPFCGFVTNPGYGEGTEGWQFDPETCVCEHTLFVATDSGFEYRSRTFNEHMGLLDDQELVSSRVEGNTTGYDGMTSRVSIPGSVKIAQYEPGASFSGLYHGFAPRATD
jgi:hypothetical protein